MKNSKYFLVVVLLLLVLVSCHQDDTFSKQDDVETTNEQESNEIKSEHENDNTLDKQNDIDKSKDEILIVNYNYSVTGNTADDFLVLIIDNPIDLKYKEICKDYDGSSRMIREIDFKYEEFWRREMEVAYNQLLNLLDEEDCQSLINSQIAWESYMENKNQIEESFFFQQKYDSLGTLRTALIFSENAEETKKRAYSLLEYLYIITGEINMVFSSEEW